jgi:hypothetical protein
MGSFTNLAGDREVSLWYEPWLKEGTVGSSIDYVNVLDTNLHVKDLWHNGTWNFTAIPAWLKERILAVPVPSLGYTADCVIWVANAAGTYSIKSAYLWLISKTNQLLKEPKWSWLWSLRTPGKIRMLIWMVFHNCLPTNLFYSGVILF